MKLIPLTEGLFAKVDDADYEWIFNFGNWHARKERNSFYACCWKDYKRVRMHVLITGRLGMDHKDNDGLNNQRDNLREATFSQNSANGAKRKVASSQYKGVCFNSRRGKWQAEICVNGKSKYLGLFLSERDAALTYNTAAKEAFGEFARINDLC